MGGTRAANCCTAGMWIFSQRVCADQYTSTERGDWFRPPAADRRPPSAVRCLWSETLVCLRQSWASADLGRLLGIRHGVHHLLIAQSLVEGLPFISIDNVFD